MHLPLLVALCPTLQDLAPFRGDWLVESPARGARVTASADGRELHLENDLIRRTLRVAPDGATVALDDLVTGASLLRAVRPEAVVVLDGVRYPVGGLAGQPNHAFLLPEWLATMTPIPGAFHLVDWEVGEPVERLAWPRVRHHAPDVAWPPPGVALHLRYRLAELPAAATAALPSEAGRERLWSDGFRALDPAWTVVASGAHERLSFTNEGKPGELLAPANCAVYAERALPAATRLVELELDAGTDRAKSRGPGLALVFDEAVVKLNLRPGGNAHDDAAMFGFFDGAREDAAAGGRVDLDLSTPWTLRLVLTDAEVVAEARPTGGAWRTLTRCARPAGAPRAVRVGKMDARGSGADHGEPVEFGELGRSRLISAAAYGPLDEAALAADAADAGAVRDVTVTVHYELYDGIPAMSKWITVENGAERTIELDAFACEVLAVVEEASRVEDRGLPYPTPSALHVETDYAMGGMTAANANRHGVRWGLDPEYSTQVNYLRNTPCLLEVGPEVGPAQTIAPGATFDSMRAFELVQDSTDRERRGLAQRRLYRTIAPWVTENPLMMHVRYADDETVRAAIDQCAEVGFEMVILTFGSGFDIEDDRPENLARWRATAAYAASKGVEIGGYSLLSSRRVSPPGDNCIDPRTGAPGAEIHGSCPALASAWGHAYLAKLYRFFDETGFRLLEHDGSYPGTLDAAARPPLQKGVADSRWVQWRLLTDFYRHGRATGVYLNVPDYYYLAGANKCGMGYREVNWSLPRAQQVLHTRQNIWDGTWEKTPSMGWMFVPLTQYHGGGAAATIEPLDEHVDHYERMLAANLGFGVQACYRGPRLYDTDRTRDAVRRWVGWFKRYRDILESDLVHGRRADGRDVDWMLHVNPRLADRGMVVVHNPLAREVTRRLRVDLRYTGLRSRARVSRAALGGEGPPVEYVLDATWPVLELEVTVPARGMASWVIR